jgi:hypothetical protein
MNFSHDIVCKCLDEDFSTKGRGPPASFIVDDDGAADESLYECRLCKIGGLTTNEMELHCKGDLHDRNVYDLNEDLRSVRPMAYRAAWLLSQPICDEIALLEQISHLPWKRDIQAELYSFIMAPPWHKREDKETDIVERPTKKLKTMLRNERLTLLGLTVWKAACLGQMPALDYHGAQTWLSSGWKQCKSEQLTSNAMDIVVSAVRSFLD